MHHSIRRYGRFRKTCSLKYAVVGISENSDATDALSPVDRQHATAKDQSLLTRISSTGAHPYWLNTHVSLLPPPCELFTTSEPFFSATRVSPPGTMLTLSPYST